MALSREPDPEPASETPLDVVRLVFPDTTDKEAESLLWARTGFPSFWHIMPPRRAILNSLRRYKRARASGLPVCDLCECRAVTPKRKPMLCRRCSKAMKQ